MIVAAEAELSYFDMLTMLECEVENDTIPENEKIEVFNLITKLKTKLWKYSY